MSWRLGTLWVGDADQSIYAFRGATIRNIENSNATFPTPKPFCWKQNYRSTQTIPRRPMRLSHATQAAGRSGCGPIRATVS